MSDIASYKLPAAFLGEKTRVLLVGAGGTGSAMIGCLAQMCVALDALGAPGLEVTVMDDDTVSQANVGRQAFAKCDIGHPKAVVLVNRINQSYGLNWKARDERLQTSTSFSWQDEPQVFIGCVDTRAERKTIHTQWSNRTPRKPAWWLDCGNVAQSGQAILGVRENGEIVLPSAGELFPEMIDAKADAKDDAPSCSLPDALTKQDLFTNRMIADVAMNLLWKLFRYGETEIHGAFVNLQTMRVNPLRIDQEGWKRMGYKPPRKKRQAAKPAAKPSQRQLVAA